MEQPAEIIRSFKLEKGHGGKRLDQVLASLLGVSRAQAGKLIAQNKVSWKGKELSKSKTLSEGEVLEVRLLNPDIDPLLTPYDLPLIYEDDQLVVVNKPPGVAAHSSRGWQGPTVVGALLASGTQLATCSQMDRPGIVHRLDAGTSGAMVVAKTPASLDNLQAQFQARTVKKTYLSVVKGIPEPHAGSIEAPIGRHPRQRFRQAIVEGGKPALTHYRVREISGEYARLAVNLATGRTHQIRVHFEAIGHPVFGDPIYSKDLTVARKIGLGRQWLHAASLAFRHPGSGELLVFEAPLFPDLTGAWEKLVLLAGGSVDLEE